jgi:hypothetical protein
MSDGLPRQDLRGKKILSVDFDGTLHSYSSGWVEADFIPDPPVDGAIEFLSKAIDWFDVHIFSSRSHQPGGIRAMQNWIKYWAYKTLKDEDKALILYQYFNRDSQWPLSKPPAHVSLDDRAWRFDGTFPKMNELDDFKPWNKI